MRLADVDDALPGRHVSRRIAGEWEDATFQCAAEESRMAVEHKLLALLFDLAKPETHCALIVGLRAFEPERELLEDGTELVPGLRICVQRLFDFGRAALLVPFHQLAMLANGEGSVASLAARITDLHLHQCGLPDDVRIYLRVLNPHGAGREKLDTSNHPVPVPLRVIGDAVRPGANVHDHAVVHPDSQRVFARLQANAELVTVRR